MAVSACLVRCGAVWLLPSRSIRDEFGVSSADGVDSSQLDILHVLFPLHSCIVLRELIYF